MSVHAEPLDLATLPEEVIKPCAKGCAEGAFTLKHFTVAANCPDNQIGDSFDEWALTGLWNPNTLVRVGSTVLPPLSAMLAGHAMDLDGELDEATLAKAQQVSWTSFAATPSGPHMTDTFGSYDSTRLAGTAERRGSVQPKELLSKAVYAYRSCASGCELPFGDVGRAERIVLIAPSAVWVGSSGGVGEARLSHDQPFSALSTVVSAGSSMSLMVELVSNTQFGSGPVIPVVTYDADALGRDPQKLSLTSVTLDIVWLSGGAPEATLYTGTTESREFGPDLPQRYAKGPSVATCRPVTHYLPEPMPNDK